MGKRGCAPTPTSILENRGSWRAKINKDEPLPEPLPEDFVPDYLTGEEVKEWNKIYPKLWNLGLITEVDETLLAVYCVTLVRYKKAIRVKYTKHTELDSYITQLMKISAKFGLSPSDRTNLKANPKKEEKEKNGIEKYYRTG